MLSLKGMMEKQNTKRRRKGTTTPKKTVDIISTQEKAGRSSAFWDLLVDTSARALVYTSAFNCSCMGWNNHDGT